MKPRPLAIATFSFGNFSLGILSCITAVTLVMPAQAENLEQTQRLLSTRQCSQCDLSQVGLVYANLAGANLSGANLVGANLSRANLAGADLRGANLVGASLYGANLVGARLDGAILQMTDLRQAYITGITYEGAVIENTMLQGAIGIPSTLVSAGEFYRWAVEDAQAGNHPRAIENFSQALERQPDLPQAYLGRAVSRVHTADRQGAIQDSQRAETLFQAKGDTQSAVVAQTLHTQLTAPPPKPQKGGNGIGTALLGLAGVVLRFLTLF